MRQSKYDWPRAIYGQVTGLRGCRESDRISLVLQYSRQVIHAVYRGIGIYRNSAINEYSSYHHLPQLALALSSENRNSSPLARLTSQHNSINSKMAIMIMKTKAVVVPQAEKLIDYKFKNPELCWEALQGKQPGEYPEGNKRLAMVGDVSMKHAQLMKWYASKSSTGMLLQD